MNENRFLIVVIILLNNNIGEESTDTYVPETLGIERNQVKAFYRVPDRPNIWQSVQVVDRIVTRY